MTDTSRRSASQRQMQDKADRIRLSEALSLDDLAQILAQGCAAAKAASTRSGYADYVRQFQEFSERRGLRSLPADAETIRFFLAEKVKGGSMASTLSKALSAIANHHRQHGHADQTKAPTIRDFLKGRRRLDAEQGNTRRKAPLLTDDLAVLAATLDADDDRCAALRDKALLLTQFAGGFRSGEVRSIHFADLDFVANGLVITLHRSKTNQEGKPEPVLVAWGMNEQTCPVIAMAKWLEELKGRGVTTGPVFPGLTYAPYGIRPRKKSIGKWGHWQMLKRRLKAAGLDADLYGTHSLRRGHATQALDSGATIEEVMTQCRWKDPTMLLLYWERGRALMAGQTSSGHLGL